MQYLRCLSYGTDNLQIEVQEATVAHDCTFAVNVQLFHV